MWTGNSAPNGSSSRWGNPAQTRECCGCPRRARSKYSGPHRPPRRRFSPAPRAASSARTAAGSCPGIRRSTSTGSAGYSAPAFPRSPLTSEPLPTAGRRSRARYSSSTPCHTPRTSGRCARSAGRPTAETAPADRACGSSPTRCATTPSAASAACRPAPCAASSALRSAAGRFRRKWQRSASGLFHPARATPRCPAAACARKRNGRWPAAALRAWRIQLAFRRDPPSPSRLCL